MRLGFNSLKRVLTIARYTAIIILIGLLMGLTSAAFLKTLELVTQWREQHAWLFWLIPAVGVLTALSYTKFGKGAHRGNNLIIDSVHENRDVPFRMTFLTFIFTSLTHLVGGSAGREGTAVQIGGALGHRLGKLIQKDHREQRILVMSGISAGFDSVFGTPLAGAFFGLEMTYIGKLNYEALLPCFLASFVADAITTALGIRHASHAILSVPALTPYTLSITLLAALLFGLVGKYFAVSVHALKQFYAQKIQHEVIRVLIASSFVLVAMIFWGGQAYAGLSTWMIDAGFAGKATLVDPVAKFVLTVLTLGAGFQGGEATPLFDIGASLGSVIGQLSHIEPSLLAALGLIAVFGSAANTPITTIILGIELFGVEAVPYYVIAALVSYYLTGHQGIYSAQKVVTHKYSIH